MKVVTGPMAERTRTGQPKAGQPTAGTPKASLSETGESKAKQSKKFFREVDEAQGGTLQLRDPKTGLADIGTCMLNTCVGIYFKVDYQRCFIAHLDARSAAVREFPVASDEAGLKIKAQVKERLIGFFKEGEWDIEHPEFGKDLHLQCPQYNKRLFRWKEYCPTTSYFAVEAIKEFFLACALYLEDKAYKRESRKILQHGRTNEESAYVGKTENLKKKAAALEGKGTHTPVEVNYHAFIVRPFEFNKILKLGYQALNDIATRDALVDYEPIMLRLPIDQCRLGVEDDDVEEIRAGLNRVDLEHERRQVERYRPVIVEMILDAREDWMDCWDDIENPTATEIASILNNMPRPPESQSRVEESQEPPAQSKYRPRQIRHLHLCP